MEKNINNLKFNKDIDEGVDSLTKSFKDYFEEITYLINKAEECQNIIDKYDEVSRSEFYKLITKFGLGTNLTRQDYTNIISLYYNREYEGPVEILTDMSCPVIEEYGYGKDLEQKREFRKVKLEVVYSNRCNISTKHRYTKEEIEELLDYQKIIILRDIVDWNYSCTNTNPYPKYDKVFGDENEIEDVSGKYYDMMLKYLRTKFDKDVLMAIKDKLVSIIKKERDIMLSIEKKFNEESFQKKLSKLENK